jgi:prevent-host-death family protein
MIKGQIAAGEFKAKCLHLLDEVQRTRQELIVTKRGRPVARVLPAEPPASAIFGRMKGTVEIVGDIVAPTGERWQADEE